MSSQSPYLSDNAAPITPEEAFIRNDSSRTLDAKEDALWSLDSLCGLDIPERASYPTVVGVTERKVSELSSQRKYSQEFAKIMPVTMKVLRNVPGVVVAGGAAGGLVWDGRRSDWSDVDFFIIGSTPEDRWETVDKVRKIIVGATAIDTNKYADNNFVYSLSRGIITITFQGATDKKYQIILRAFPSVSSLLHGFDIGSSAVAFDGKTTYFTGLGAYAYAYGINLVNPAYRSTTFEARLGKYFKRGFALGLPLLDVSKALPGEMLLMSHLTVSVHGTAGNTVTGHIMVSDRYPSSDYDPFENMDSWASGKLVRTWGIEYNIRSLNAGNGAYAHTRVITRGKPKKNRWGEMNSATPMSKLSDKDFRCDTVGDLLTRKDVEWVADSAIASCIYISYHSWSGLVRPVRLHITLGMTAEEVGVFTAAVSTQISSKERGGLSASARVSPDPRAALAPFKKRLIRRYLKEAATPIEWWIVDDPSRQYTVSLNPRIEDPADWYGSSMVGAKSPGGSDCSICLKSVPLGEAGTVRLKCGHVFHAGSKSCQGVEVLSVRPSDAMCPMCEPITNDHPGIANHFKYMWYSCTCPITIKVDWEKEGVVV